MTWSWVLVVEVDSFGTRAKRSIFQFHTDMALLSGQRIQAPVIRTFKPPATQSTICIFPLPSLINPPATAPTSIITKARARLFRLMLVFHPPTSWGSEARSHNILVSTTLGISLKFSTLLPMIWPADWNESNAIGISDFHWISLVIVSRAPSTLPAWTMAPEMNTRVDWKRKEAVRVPRRTGPKRRENWEKNQQPRKKQESEVRDLAQP